MDSIKGDAKPRPRLFNFPKEELSKIVGIDSIKDDELLRGFTKEEVLEMIEIDNSTITNIARPIQTLKDRIDTYRNFFDKYPKRFESFFGFIPSFAK